MQLQEKRRSQGIWEQVFPFADRILPADQKLHNSLCLEITGSALLRLLPYSLSSADHSAQSSPNSSAGCWVRMVPLPQTRALAGQ